MRAALGVPIGGIIAGALAGGAAAWLIRSRRRAQRGAGRLNGSGSDPELVVLQSASPEELRGEVAAASSSGLTAKARAAVKLGEELAASIAHRVIASVPERMRRPDGPR